MSDFATIYFWYEKSWYDHFLHFRIFGRRVSALLPNDIDRHHSQIMKKLIKRATWTNNKDKPCVSISCSASGIRGVYCQIQANYSHNQVRWLRSFYENGTTSTVICEIDMLSPSTIQFLENDFRLIVATPCLSNILESRNTCSKFVVLSVIHAYILFIGMLLQNERDIHNWKIAIILFVVSRPSLSISGLRS